jgi:hypothetical protein
VCQGAVWGGAVSVVSDYECLVQGGCAYKVAGSFAMIHSERRTMMSDVGAWTACMRRRRVCGRDEGMRMRV